MALQVWLPLNGNLNNQGLTNVTVTNSGATVDNNGKIGKCYYFDGTDDRISCSSLTIKYPMTIAGWFKPTNVTASATQYWISYNTNMGGTDGHSIGIGTYNGIPTVWYNGNASNLSTSLSNNVWYHIAVTIDENKKVSVYLNGASVATFTSTATQPNSTWITLGARSNSSTGGAGGAAYYYKGYMNDARVYDSCLSPKQIEILSRGLVCHYPLNNNGGGQPNLYDFESVASKWAVDGLTLANATDDVYGNVLKITSPSSVTSQRIYRSVSNVWKADTKFTVSFLAKASKTAVVKMSRSLANYAPDVTVGTTWKRYSTVITCSTTVEGGTLSIQTSTASADIYLTQIKVELGDKATAYCPGVGDSHYIPLGYDSTTEYDVSGYGYNGTKYAYDSTGSIEYDSTTPRYSVSTFINSANVTNNATGMRYIYGNCELTTPQYLTVAFWCNPIAGYGGITNNGIFALTNNDIGVGAATDYNTAPMHNRDADIDMCTSTNVHRMMAFTTTANEWHHYAVVYDGRYGKVYKDGVHTATLDMGSNLSLASFKAIVIGYSHAGGVYRKVRAYYSDFRIYATALSAAQIAELYNMAVSVANNGTLMGYELVEG